VLLSIDDWYAWRAFLIGLRHWSPNFEVGFCIVHSKALRKILDVDPSAVNVLLRFLHILRVHVEDFLTQSLPGIKVIW